MAYQSPYTQDQRRSFMLEAIRLSQSSLSEGRGGPFGCVIVKEGKIVGRGQNKVTSLNDPTAHAEVVAIRDACQHMQSFQLEGCEIYTSCEPCPMCLGAIYWARPQAIFFANTREDAAAVGFDDQFIYDEIPLPHAKRGIPIINEPSEEAILVFQEWTRLPGKKDY